MRWHQWAKAAAMTLFLCGGARIQASVSDEPVRQAQKQVTAAESDVHKAMIALRAEAKRILAELEATPEWKQAAAGAREAQGAYTAAVKQARSSIAADPQYKAALGARAARQAERDALRGDPKASPERVTEAAVAVLNANAAVSRIEREAAAKDPAVVKANEAVEQANARLADLRNTLADRAAKDAAYQSAKQRLEQVALNVQQARKQLALAKQQHDEAERQQLDQDLDAQRQRMRDAAGFRR